jgi:hypothetical protein
LQQTDKKKRYTQTVETREIEHIHMDDISEISDELTRLSLDTATNDAMSLATTTNSLRERNEEIDETATIADAAAENFDFEDPDGNDEWVFITPVTATPSFEQRNWLVVNQPETTFLPPELYDDINNNPDNADDAAAWDPSALENNAEWDPPSNLSDFLDKEQQGEQNPLEELEKALLYQTPVPSTVTTTTNNRQQQQKSQDDAEIQKQQQQMYQLQQLQQQQMAAMYQLFMQQQAQQFQQLQQTQPQHQSPVPPQQNLLDDFELVADLQQENYTQSGPQVDSTLLLAQHHNFVQNWGATSPSNVDRSNSTSPQPRNIVQDMRFMANFTPNLTRTGENNKEKNLAQFSQQLDWEIIQSNGPSTQNQSKRRTSTSTRSKRGGSSGGIGKKR